MSFDETPTEELSVQFVTAYHHLLPQHPVSWLADMQSEPHANKQNMAAEQEKKKKEPALQ